MKRVFLNQLMFLIAMVTSFALFNAAIAIADSKSQTSSCEDLLSNLFKMSEGPFFEFEGVTADGLKLIEKTATDLQHNEAAFNKLIEGQEALFNTHLLTAVTSQNHLVLGPPGAAKTMGITYLFSDIWSKQVQEWTTPFEIFGGQTKAGQEQGKEDINTEGSVLNAEFALIDEINNANPSLLGAMLKFLNPGERGFDVAGRTMKAKTRAVYSTGNASRIEILTSFIQRQMQSGPALLNRFAFKSFVNNWRNQAQQIRLDEVYKQIERLKMVAKYGNAQQKEQAQAYLEKTLARPLNYEVIENLGTFAFTTSPLLEMLSREFVNKMRIKMNDQSLKSKDAAATDKAKIPFEPSTEWTERVRGQFLKLIRYSAALDLLRLPEEVRKELLKKPIELSAVSLWRVVNMSITNSEGIVFFNLPQMKIEFNIVKSTDSQGQTKLEAADLTQMAAHARDKREQQQFEDLLFEQTAFNEVLTDILTETSKNNKDVAAILSMTSDPDLEFENTDFENLVFGHLWSSLASTLNTK